MSNKRAKLGTEAETGGSREKLMLDIALYLLAANQRCVNDPLRALNALARLEQQHSSFSLLYQERGYCHTALHNVPEAINAFVHAVKLNPALFASWMMLERLYRAIGQPNAASHMRRHRGLAPTVSRELWRGLRHFGGP